MIIYLVAFGWIRKCFTNVCHLARKLKHLVFLGTLPISAILCVSMTRSYGTSQYVLRARLLRKARNALSASSCFCVWGCHVGTQFLFFVPSGFSRLSDVSGVWLKLVYYTQSKLCLQALPCFWVKARNAWWFFFASG